MVNLCSVISLVLPEFGTALLARPRDELGILERDLQVVVVRLTADHLVLVHQFSSIFTWGNTRYTISCSASSFMNSVRFLPWYPSTLPMLIVFTRPAGSSTFQVSASMLLIFHESTHASWSG